MMWLTHAYRMLYHWQPMAISASSAHPFSRTNDRPKVLEVRHLRAVDAISREGTVTAAAERLYLTQSAVSHLLKDLETRLGVELFDRERGMEPTEEGKRLLRSARVVLEELDRAEYDLEQLRDGYQGVLRVATECYTCYHWLPRILSRFRERFPGIDLQIVPEATNRPIQALLDCELDLAIIHRVRQMQGIETTELFIDELVAVMPPHHRLAKRRWLSPEDFRGENLIVHFFEPEGPTVATEFLWPAGVEPERILELQLTDAVLEAVKAGLGITVMAQWAVAPEVQDGSLVEVRLSRKGLKRAWHAAVPARRAELPAVEALLELLERDALKEVRGRGRRGPRVAVRRRS